MRLKAYFFTLLLCMFSMLFGAQAFAQSVNVGSAAELNGALTGISTTTVVFSTNITMNVAVSAVSNTPQKTIEGSGFTLDGVGATNRFGFSSTIANSTFTINDLTIKNFRRSGNGAGLSIDASTDRINFYGNNLQFSTNSAQTAGSMGGGAYINNADAVFSGSTTFAWNTATSGGGAIAGVQDSKITFNGITSFVSNVSASGDGGAVYASGSEIVFNDAAFFTRNSALRGGAIASLSGSTITFNSDVTFTSNTTTANTTARGGAIYSEGGIFNFNSSAVFEYGYSGGNAGGGAIHGISGSEFNFAGQSFFLNNNTVQNNAKGGAIALTSSTIVFSTVTAHGNTVSISNGGLGGFLYAMGSTVTFKGTAYIGGLGAGEGNTSAQGAGIYATAGTFITFEKEAFFRGNQAGITGQGVGAAISAVGADSIIFKDNVIFQSNNGSSIFYSSGTSLLFEKQVTFTQNTGTALNTQFSNAVFEDVVIFDSNSVVGNGGAIISGNSSLIFNKQVLFASNTASLNGGAVYLTVSTSPITFNDSVLFTGNRAEAGAGGAVFSNGGPLVFNGSSTVFSGNFAKTIGGAVYMTGLGDITFGDASSDVLTAINNTAESNGGFLYSNTGRNITLNATSVFTGNTGASGGALYSNASALVQGYINFNAAATFDTNISTRGSGGAIWGNFTNLSFSTTTVFRNNKAANIGGAIYLTSMSTSAFSENVLFQNNISSDSAGAIYAGSNVDMQFNGSQTAFDANKSTGTGGAVQAAGLGRIVFGDSSSDIFEAYNNISWQSSGGFLSASGGKEIVFNSSSAVSGNKAELNGGAVNMESSSTLIINNYAEFQGNKAISGNGGALSLTNSTLDASAASSEIKFLGNTAAADGGAIYFFASSANVNNALFAGNSALNGGALSVQWTSGVNITSSSFIGNTALDNGGALALSNSTITVTNAKFLNNTAGAKGGAVYLRGNNSAEVAYFYSDTVSSGDSKTVFSGNKAAGVSNGFHMDEFSEAYFHADDNTSVEFYDNISASTFTTVLGYAGEGDFNFYGSLNGVGVIHLSALNGGAFNLKSGSSMNSFILSNDADSRLMMVNGTADSVYLSEFLNDGIVGMDIFYTDPETNDKIIASKDVKLSSSTSKLEIKADFADSHFRKKIYKLIYFGNTLNGEFSDLDIDTSVLFSTTPVLSYGTLVDNWITLTLEGFDRQTHYSSLADLTFNQSEVAKAFDALSDTLPGGGDLDVILGIVSAGSESTQKHSLSNASGYFLANVIRNAAADSPNNEIYDRIKNNCIMDKTNTGIWVQAKGGIETFYGDKDSPEDYNDISQGFMAGVDRYIADKEIMLGVYGRYSAEEIEQDENKADGMKTGVGVYGGFIKEKWELKAMLLGSWDTFDTERYIEFMDRKAKADISAFTFSGDIEGALKYSMSKYTNFRPYLGLEIEDTSYNGFKERGADALNLYVKDGNYIRSAARGGLSIVYDDKYRWSGYAAIEGKYLVSGVKPEIESVFAETDVDFRSVGAEEGRVEAGAGLGGAVRIYKGLKLFANANYYAGSHYRNIYGNVGLRYTFCSMTKKDYKEVAKEKARERFAKFCEDNEECVVEYMEEWSKKNEPETKTVATVAAELVIMETTVNTKETVKETAKELPVLPHLLKNNVVKVYFASGKYKFVNDKAKKAIDEAIAAAASIENSEIAVVGHADVSGGNQYNLTLSDKRAQGVYDYIILKNPEIKVIRYFGVGKDDLKAGSIKEVLPEDRRVDVFIVYGDTASAR